MVTAQADSVTVEHFYKGAQHHRSGYNPECKPVLLNRHQHSTPETIGIVRMMQTMMSFYNSRISKFNQTFRQKANGKLTQRSSSFIFNLGDIEHEKDYG